MRPRQLCLALLSAVVLFVFVGGPAWQTYARQQQAKLDGELTVATYKGDAPAVRSLLERGASPDARFGRLCEWEFGPKGELWIVEITPFRSCFPWNMLPTRRRASGEPVLVYAAMAGHADIFYILLKRGADVRLRDASDRTALIAAAWRGDLEMCRALLARGADARIRDRRGLTARDWAVRVGHSAVVKLLDTMMMRE